MAQTKDIRNVCLMSHGNAGKTSLVEAMLYNAKLIDRLGKIEDGNTVSDFDAEEIKRKISINTSLISFEFENCKYNILDTIRERNRKHRCSASITDAPQG